MIGLQSGWQKFLTFLVIALVHAFLANALGLMIGSGVPNASIGLVVGPLLVVVFLLFGGQLINLKSLPASLKWVPYLSPITYSIKALTQNEFNGAKFDACSPNASLCFPSGDAVVKLWGYDDIELWTAVYCNLALTSGFLILGFVFYLQSSKPHEILKVSPHKEKV